MGNPFKNLKAPAGNTNAPPREELAPIPVTPDPTRNDEPVNTTLDGERPIPWPAPQTLPENRPPFKIKK